LKYVLLGSTQLSLSGARSLQPSYDLQQPYYVQTGGLLTISQRIYGPLDFMARGGAQWLKFRTQTGVVIPEPNRTDRVQTYGGGFGIHLGDDLRIGLNVDQEERRSIIVANTYKKAWSSVTVGR
jgi:hypothetical protein